MVWSLIQILAPFCICDLVEILIYIRNPRVGISIVGNLTSQRRLKPPLNHEGMVTEASKQHTRLVSDWRIGITFVFWG